MKKGQDEIGSQMDEKQVVDFENYLGLLLKWNRAYNLTAITDPIEVYEKHFADSATPIQYIPKKAKMADIGAGAGFPGVPIKILRNDVAVTLIEAKTKKVNFCEHVIRELGLKGIKVINGRAEDATIFKNAGKFDIVISRATLKLPNFIKVGAPYLKKGGQLLAMMGSSWSDDLDKAIPQVKKSGLKLVKIHEYVLPVSQSKRALLVFEKK
jgi:16S rRNA (guanine527-N7)-methyltransferase